VHAQAEREGIVRTFLLRAEYLEVCLVALGRLLRETTKKVVNFLRKKTAHPDKNMATPMDGTKQYFEIAIR